MYVDHLPQDSSVRILDVIKSSNIHFNIQETPHSVYITIRKKFVRESPVKMSNHVSVEQNLASLEEANSNLRNDLEEKLTVIESLQIVHSLLMNLSSSKQKGKNLKKKSSC